MVDFPKLKPSLLAYIYCLYALLKCDVNKSNFGKKYQLVNARLTKHMFIIVFFSFCFIS